MNNHNSNSSDLPTVPNLIDLSHTITSTMPTYPGVEPPSITTPYTIKKHGFTQKRINTLSHIGTHIDAPSHILKEGATLDQFKITDFFDNALCVDVSETENRIIDTKYIGKCHPSKGGDYFLLLYTGWFQHWGKNRYYQDFPILSEELARLLSYLRIKGIGIDAPSVDPIDSLTLPIHQILMQKNILIIENLTNLQKLIMKEFTFCCFPLKIDEAEGSPVRAVAILN